MSEVDIVIAPVEDTRGRRDFIRVAPPIYADDPHYIAPLEYEVGPRIDPTKNPTLSGADHQLWIATRKGEAVGRISAIINPLHLERHQDETGHFGFFEAIDDEVVITALIKTASDWLRANGMKYIAGPYNFSVNEEVGLLVDGFDTPPFVMMPHGRSYYPAHLEELGFKKAIDMHALFYNPIRNFIPERRKRFVEKVLSTPKVNVRNLDTSRFTEDILTLIDIYDDAWSDNWGYIPFTPEQAQQMVNELKPILVKENVVICEYDDEPVAMGLVLPNINEAIAGFNGRLLPFNWAKLLWKLKVSGIKSARMPLMGVRKSLQGKPIGAAFAYKIIDMVNQSNMDRGVGGSELSWILETNESMLNMLTDMGARIYKTYRIYKKPL